MSPVPPPAAQRSWLRRLLNRWEVDQAVFYALLSRGWQLLAGGVSMLVYAQAFSPRELGVYGMFATLMALHLLVELGLSLVAATLASHEWARLRLDVDGTISGDTQGLERLADLHRRLRAWYAGLAAVSTAVVGVGGYLFLAARTSPEIAWRLPWAGLVLVSGPSLALWGRIALLEGCQQVRAVQQLRFVQALVGNLIVWPAMLAGAGLWAAMIGAAVRWLGDIWLIRGRYRSFFVTLERHARTDALDWNTEVRPLQWRIAVRSLAGWVAIQLFAPVLYRYHGEVETGRFWLTWTALTAIEGAAFAWIQTRAPLLGSLVARGEYRELDRVFHRVGSISTLALGLGGALLCIVIAALPVVPLAIAPKLSARLLPVGTVAVFVAAMVIYNVVRCCGLYVQAHKRDPFLRVHLLCCLAMGLAVWWGGKAYGALGEAWGFLLVVTTMFLPIWMHFQRRCRREWQPGRDPAGENL